MGQYAGPTAQKILKGQGRLGKPLGHRSIQACLIALRRFFSDLQKRPHSVQGEPARKIPLHFNPHISFTVPDATRRAIEDIEPRDIDLTIWHKLAGAAARLSEADLPRSHQYPLSLYRAVSLLWITTARRPNELQRLRLDCVRREWDHEMIDEDGFPLEAVKKFLSLRQEKWSVTYGFPPINTVASSGSGYPNIQPMPLMLGRKTQAWPMKPSTMQKIVPLPICSFVIAASHWETNFSMNI
jgi:hypothetical protein